MGAYPRDRVRAGSCWPETRRRRSHGWSGRRWREDSLAGPAPLGGGADDADDGRTATPVAPRRYEEVTRVEYDRAGRRTELVRTDSGVVTSRIVYTHDEAGRNTGHVRFAGTAERQRLVVHVRRAGRGGGKADHRRDRGDGALRPRRGGAAAGERARGRPPHGRTATTSGAGAWRRCTGWRTAPCWGPRGGSTAPAGTGAAKPASTAGDRVPLGLRDAPRRGRAGWRSGRSARRTQLGRLSASHAPVPGREVITHRDGGRTVETMSFAPDGALRGGQGGALRRPRPARGAGGARAGRRAGAGGDALAGRCRTRGADGSRHGAVELRRRPPRQLDAQATG